MTKRKPTQEQLFAAAQRTVRTRAGLDEQIREQRKLGQLEPVDGGIVKVMRDWADTLDAAAIAGESAYSLSMGYRDFLAAMRLLRGDTVQVSDPGLDAEFTALVAALRDAPRPGT